MAVREELRRRARTAREAADDVSDRLVPVAAAVIVASDGRVLLAQRPAGKAYAGYWEFPGGKIEPGETAPEALARELREELGITVRRAAPWLVQKFRYPHAHVELHFFRVFAWQGEPVGHDGQAFAWQTPGRFDVLPLLPANTFVMRALLLPAVYGITNADDVGETAFLGGAERAIASGLRLIQLREKAWPLARQRAFADALLALTAPQGVNVLLNGDPRDAAAWGCAGVHLTSAALARIAARPLSETLLCAASCHTRAEIERAAALNLDFAVLGPVLPTPTHPGARTLGWEGFAALAREAPLPIFALGGLTHADLDRAIAHGAHGVALRRAAWS
jgi:8-oxo-dGTP diphosphatase